MIRNEKGLSLIELMVTMVVFLLVIAASSQIFTALLTQFKQQGKIAESNTEGIVGLDMLRRDIAHAGHGLAWGAFNGFAYAEVPAGNAGNAYNDAPGNLPRAFVSGNGSGMNGSDEFVVKSTNVATSDAAQKSAYITNQAGWPNRWSTVANSNENLALTDRIISLIPISGASQRVLANAAGNFFTTRNDPAFSSNNGAGSPYEPAQNSSDTYIAYVIDPDTDPRMPFNRADYYISNSNVPLRCAMPGAGTGVLVKSVINQATGTRGGGLPLMDCVADMQVCYRADSDNNGTIDVTTDNISGYTAAQVRQIKEVRVYILSHEGQRDPNYTYPSSTIVIPAAPDPCAGVGRTFDFTNVGAIGTLTNWRNYRWKVYTLVVEPNNLR